MQQMVYNYIDNISHNNISQHAEEKANGPPQRNKKKTTNIVVHPSTSLQCSEVGDVEFTTCPSQSSAPAPPAPPVPAAPPAAPPCPPCLPPEVESLRSELEDLQSKFLAKVKTLPHNIPCKLVTLMQNGNSQMILCEEDRISLPKNIREFLHISNSSHRNL